MPHISKSTLLGAFILLSVAGCRGDSTSADELGDSGPQESGTGTDTFESGESLDAGSDTSSDGSDTDCAGPGSCDPPEVPSLQLEISQVKQFHFNWTPTLGVQYYRLLESADAGDPFAQLGGDLVGLANTRTMPLHFRANASYILQACNRFGCTDSAVLDMLGSMAPAVGYFKASNTSPSHGFGHALALSADGSTLAVGAQYDASNAVGIDGEQTDTSATNSGAVYVYVRMGLNDWTQQAYVKASNTGAGDSFGHSVALSADGSTLAVGADFESSNAAGIDGNQADDSASASGAVYVYERDGMNAWTQRAYLKASNTGEGDWFGWSVALSGDGATLAVGANNEDSNALGIGGNQANDSSTDAGAVYVYAREGLNVWTQQAYVKASNTDANDHFGNSVALSGDGSTLAVGAYFESSNAVGIEGDQADNSALSAGAVYVYVRNGLDVWTQQAYVKASNTGAGDNFGNGVALSADGSTLAVGALYEDSNAVGLAGDQADNSASNAGAAYVYVRNGLNVWTQEAYVKASNTDVSDFFGYAVALSGDGSALAVGARWEAGFDIGIASNQADNSASSAGAVYVYARKGLNLWTQRSYVKAPNSDANDYFGVSLALSEDGNTLAVGASGEDSNAVGIAGDQADNSAQTAGAVYLY